MATRDSFHHGALRDAAISAALSLVERDGPDGLSLRAVAEAAGVNHRALYRHFADKDALAVAVAAIGFERLADRIHGAIAESPDPADDTRPLQSAYVDFAFAEPGLYALMFGMRGQSFLDDPVLAPAVARVTNLAAVAFRRPDDPPGFSPAQRDRVIVAWGMAHGLIDLWRRGALRARGAEEARAYIAGLLELSP